MSGLGPGSSGSNPFEGLFGELARLLGGDSGPLNWDVARQVAVVIAGEGRSEGNVDPIDRIRLEELVRIAEMHVNQEEGLSLVVRKVDAISHIEWANRSLESYKNLLTSLATALGRRPSEDPPIDAIGANPLNDMEKWMGPVLLGMQAGGMVGHLARRCLGQFDLPIPRSDTDGIVLVPDNISAFAESWSLPLDELSLYVSVEEVVRVAVFQHEHVRARFTELISQYVSGFEPNPTALEERIGLLGLEDPTQLTGALDDPEALLGAIQTPAQQTTLVHLHALVAVFVGYVDYVSGKIAAKTIASGGLIDEASKRRRVEESSGNQLVDKLFGLELSQAQFDRGENFIRGVIERSDNDDSVLARLWLSERELPTPAEVDAPGLWLERINIPD